MGHSVCSRHTIGIVCILNVHFSYFFFKLKIIPEEGVDPFLINFQETGCHFCHCCMFFDSILFLVTC